jgi:hypothetical protein
LFNRFTPPFTPIQDTKAINKSSNQTHTNLQITFVSKNYHTYQPPIRVKIKHQKLTNLPNHGNWGFFIFFLHYGLNHWKLDQNPTFNLQIDGGANTT